MPCRSVPGGGLVPRGVSNFFFGGVSNFGGSPIFLGGSPIFRGGERDVWNTVNVRPVRILLECILVNNFFQDISSIFFPGVGGGD